MSALTDCHIIDLPRITDRRGNITPIHAGKDIPFDVVRIFYLYDVPGGSSRAGHANTRTQQVIVSVMGAFDVVLDDGIQQKRVHLDRAYHGLYIPTMIWREIENFSSGAICLVLASHPYNPNEYIRDHSEFKSRRQEKV